MTTSPPDPEARKQAIAGVFDRGAGDYDTIGEFFTPIARDLVALAEVGAGDRVLDVGCGRGAVTFAAAPVVGASGSVTAIDLAPRMVELTAAEASARGLDHVQVAVGDADAPELPPGSFDAVLASFVVFFLPDPRAALERYRALLASGGRLGFTTFGPQDVHFEAAMRAIGSFIPGPVPERGDRQGPFASADGISALLGAAGYARSTVDERTYETRFRDPDEWLAWAWSHGGRATLERVPEAVRDEAEATAKQAIAGARTPDGDLVLHTTIRLTVARPV